MRRVLITGGAGFIGHHLIKFLIAKRIDVLVIDNEFSGKRELLPKNVELNTLDIRSQKIKEIISNFDPDIIIHLAAIHYIPYCNKNPEETFDVNVMGTYNVVKYSCKDNKDRLFVFASSAAVYPPKDGPLSEEVDPNPIDIYGKTKLIGEKLVELFCSNAIILRIFNVYGENDTNSHLIPEIINQLKHGTKIIKLGNLQSKRDFVHVDDVCRIIITLIENNARGTFNIGSGNEYSIMDLINIISDVVGEKIYVIQDASRVRKIDRMHLLSDITKIKRVGCTPTITLREGIERLLKHEGLA